MKLKTAMWALSLGLFVSLSGITLSSCAGGDKGKGGDELAGDEGGGEEDGDKKKKKKAKHAKKKKKPAGGDSDK